MNEQLDAAMREIERWIKMVGDKDYCAYYEGMIDGLETAKEILEKKREEKNEKEK